MKRNIILGGGVVGLLARYILGDDWTIIPFGRSRFYSFVPTLCDNYIVRDAKIDDFVEHLGSKTRYMYQIRYSYQGEIMEHNNTLCDFWLHKTFKNNPPHHAAAYLSSRKNFWIYDLRIHEVYQKLQEQYKAELIENSKSPTPTEIGDHHIIWNGQKHDFDNCISTIPLYSLLSLANLNSIELNRSPCYYFHIQTNNLDFEGSNQLFIADPEYDFFKVARVAEDRYMFYCLNNIPTPGAYFMAFMKKHDILDGTWMEDAIIQGQRPKLSSVDALGVRCIGSYAEWDWCADVGSNIMSIMRYKNDILSNKT